MPMSASLLSGLRHLSEFEANDGIIDLRHPPSMILLDEESLPERWEPFHSATK